MFIGLMCKTFQQSILPAQGPDVLGNMTLEKYLKCPKESQQLNHDTIE